MDSSCYFWGESWGYTQLSSELSPVSVLKLLRITAIPGREYVSCNQAKCLNPSIIFLNLIFLQKTLVASVFFTSYTAVYWK